MTTALTLDQLLSAIQSDDANTRTNAWYRADQVGPSALVPLAQIVTHPELEVRRAALRAMWKITRSLSAPAAAQRGDGVAALCRLLADDQPEAVRREVLWMLSEIASGDAVAHIAPLLEHDGLREDCRMVLERIPGEESLVALQAGLATADNVFGFALAESLRARGQQVDGYPSQKLVPQKATTVTGQ